MRTIQRCCTSCTLFTVTENVEQLLHITYGLYSAHDNLYFSHLFLYVQSSGMGSSPDVIWWSTKWSQGIYRVQLAHILSSTLTQLCLFYQISFLNSSSFFPQGEVRNFLGQILLATRKSNVRKKLSLTDVQPYSIGEAEEMIQIFWSVMLPWDQEM